MTDAMCCGIGFRTNDGYAYERVPGPRAPGVPNQPFVWTDIPPVMLPNVPFVWRDTIPVNPITEPPMYFPGANWAGNQLYA